MAGVFNPAARPRLAGSYFNWEAEGTVTVPPSIGGIVAIPATHDWGPVNTAALLQDFDEFRQIFGASADTDLYRAVYGAFKGEGRDGNFGAGAVIAYRMATAAAAAATRALQNTTPVAALTLTARYSGTRGNDFRVTVQASATVGKSELLLLDGSLVVETYTFNTAYAAGDATALAAEINARSNWVTAVVGTTGVSLATVSAQALAGGNDGTVLTAAEWLAAQDALDSERWSVISPYGLIDSAIRAAFAAWIKERNLLGRRSRAVIGGAASEDLATANARSIAINDWDVLNVGASDFFLDDLGVAASSAQFAPRVAGSIARRGETRDVFYARFADVSLTSAVTLAEEEDALDAGTIVFTRDTNAVPVFIREGVTTYSDDSQSPVDSEGNKTHPVDLYRRIKNLAIQHAIELEVDEWATGGGVLGDQPVNDRVRGLVLGFVMTLYQRREDAEIIQPGWTVGLDPDVPVSDDDDFICYLHGFHPTRSLRQMFHRARVG